MNRRDAVKAAIGVGLVGTTGMASEPAQELKVPTLRERFIHAMQTECSQLDGVPAEFNAKNIQRGLLNMPHGVEQWYIAFADHEDNRWGVPFLLSPQDVPRLMDIVREFFPKIQTMTIHASTGHKLDEIMPEVSWTPTNPIFGTSGQYKFA